MSIEGIEAKKELMRNYFDLHPDSREVTVVGSGQVINALFDYAYMTGEKDAGNIEQKKRVPHLTFFSEDAQYISPDDQIQVGAQTYTVWRVTTDLTEETFQGEVWMI